LKTQNKNVCHYGCFIR